MTFKCIKSCTLPVWDGSGNKVEVSAGEKLEMTYHEYNGTIGLDRDGVELHCSAAERCENFEVVE